MPILLILILALIIAQVGFWKTLGAIAMIVLLVVLCVLALGILGAIVTRRARRQF